MREHPRITCAAKLRGASPPFGKSCTPSLRLILAANRQNAVVLRRLLMQSPSKGGEKLARRCIPLTIFAALLMPAFACAGERPAIVAGHGAVDLAARRMVRAAAAAAPIRPLPIPIDAGVRGFDLRATGSRAQAFRLDGARHLPRIDSTLVSHLVSASPDGRDGGRYAVRDTMADRRRTGPPKTLLDALLVFRIDGDPDSAPLSVGGGVAGIMWEAGTRH